jgi:hypothetical protein
VVWAPVGLLYHKNKKYQLCTVGAMQNLSALKKVVKVVTIKEEMTLT